MQAQPWVAQLVKQRVPERLSEGPFVALHMRVGTNMTGEDDPSWGRNKEGVRPYMAGLDKLDRGSNRTVYVMTDDPSLTEERLRELAPGVSFVRPRRDGRPIGRHRGRSELRRVRRHHQQHLLADL